MKVRPGEVGVTVDVNEWAYRISHGIDRTPDDGLLSRHGRQGSSQLVWPRKDLDTWLEDGSRCDRL